MPATPNHFDTDVDASSGPNRAAPHHRAGCERLSLQSRIVRNKFAAEILSDIGARIWRATLLESSNVLG